MSFDNPLAFCAVNAKRGHGHITTIDQRGCPRNTDQPAPGACADQGTEIRLLKIEWEAISARAAPTVDQHRLRPGVGGLGPAPILTVADAPVIDRFAPEHFHKTVRNLAAAIEPFVNDQTVFAELGAKLPHQLRLSA